MSTGGKRPSRVVLQDALFGGGVDVVELFSGNKRTVLHCALKTWLEAAGIVEGPLFREVTRHGRVESAPLTGRSLSRIVKRAAGAAGLEAATFSGHSLRAGFVTQAKIKGRAEDALMRQTGHRSVVTVRKYDRRANLWRDNAAAGLLD